MIYWWGLFKRRLILKFFIKFFSNIGDRPDTIGLTNYKIVQQVKISLIIVYFLINRTGIVK